MKRSILAALALALTLPILAACGALTPPGSVPVSPSAPAAVQAAQSTINEANVLITASATVIERNVAEGVMTGPEAQDAVARLRQYAGHMDEAQRLLERGDILAAKNRAEIANRLILQLHRELAARARKESR